MHGRQGGLWVLALMRRSRPHIACERASALFLAWDGHPSEIFCRATSAAPLTVNPNVKFYFPFQSAKADCKASHVSNT